MLLSLIVSSEFYPSDLIPALKRVIQRVTRAYRLLRKYQRCKGMALSLNHLLLLLEKEALNLPILPNETEQKSYLDIKKYFKQDWPFMLSVN